MRAIAIVAMLYAGQARPALPSPIRCYGISVDGRIVGLIMTNDDTRVFHIGVFGGKVHAGHVAALPDLLEKIGAELQPRPCR